MNSKVLATIATLALTASAFAGDAAKPVSDPVVEAPTLRSLGMRWIISGDDNANAAVTLSYRKAGVTEWTTGMPLFRVEKGAHDPKKADHQDKEGRSATFLDVPADGWLFAGNALLLTPGSEYELKLTLKDPDGGEAEQTLRARTAVEPLAPANAPTLFVIPGDGGGSGTKADPFKGLVAAQKAAKPGHVLLLAPGTYEKAKVSASGEPDKPIIWRGADREKTIFKGGPVSAAELKPKDKNDGFAERIIDATGAQDVWFENLTLSHGRHAIVAQDAARIVIRGCHVRDVFFGVTATRNPDDRMTGFFILDNVFEGVSKFPRTKDSGIEDSRGVQITGHGSVVAYNRFYAFGDAVDTFGSVRCENIDIHNNDIDVMTDDGIESDYSQRNVRIFENRLTNVYQGISCQPVYGGPVYIFRNVMYGITIEPFKLHNAPSGAVLMHNTIVKEGHAWELWTGKPVHNIISRNNLFLGTSASYCFVAESGDTAGCDFDYDGFGGMAFKQFLKWNKQKYATIEEVREKGPIYKHAAWIDPATAFASGVQPPESDQTLVKPADLRPGQQSGAVDKGIAVPGLNDGFKGLAPDLGAYELDQDLPQYGPRTK